ncbi:MAG: N-acetyl-gamma-glutamyl-phosphate reductase [Melioribacteraceae bacterium]|nr:N-acetyl-gamma-glutamyl-phosphate reductase [Melioribacteraceae bacterium]
MRKMIKVGIVGAAGYSGSELIKILLNHSETEIVKLFGHSTVGSRIENVHSNLRGIISHEIELFEESKLTGLDIVFVALPSGQSMEIIAKIYNAGIKVIDLGGDFRLDDTTIYKKYYKHEHTAPELLKYAVYGLSEWNSKLIESARLVANPGCYPTSVLLPLLPLIRENILADELISIVSYSGTSGAGKSLSSNMLFSEVNESVRAYKVGTHQHIPEIDKYINDIGKKKASFSFIPHLLPVTRGIYTTIHAKLNSGNNFQTIKNIYSKYYSDKMFIRLSEQNVPELKDVNYTNFCDISWSVLDDDTLVLISAIDNLIKGAAGQAVQNMNIMFGLMQNEGIMKWKLNQ